MFTRVIKRSRSMRVVGPGQHAGDDVVAHGPARPSSPSGGGPASVSDPPGPALHDASWQAVQNAGQSPDHHFADGRNLYLERPLPPPPPPKNAAPVTFAMPARPSTSGGPNAKASAFLGLTTTSRPIADKRLSKDDMYLTGYTGGQRKRGLQPYRVGMRGGLPTPEDSPDMDYPVLSLPTAVPPRMHTPDTLSSGEIQIGMALGSPSRRPDALPWESQPPPGRQPPTPPDLYQGPTAPVVQRQKTQRRKLFGGLFGSRKKEEQPRASPEPTESGSVVSSTTTTSMANQPFGESTPVRSNTVADDRKAPRYRPIVIRSNTLPVVETPTKGINGGGKSEGPQMTMTSDLKYTRNNYLSPNPPAPSSGSGPFLDIEIPSIKMERYSVMFSNVLQPQATSSSLLARRQATLEKLRTINDRILHEEEEKERWRGQQRRATSPLPTKSPAAGFTLFPPTPNRHHHGSSPLAPGRLARSNTSPGLLPSPSRPGFDHGAGAGTAPARKDRKTVTIISPRSMEQRNNNNSNQLPPPSRANAQQQPERTVPTEEAATFQFGPDVSGLVLDSPQSMDEPSSSSGGRFVVDAQPLRPAVPEPEWQMISGPPAAAPLVATEVFQQQQPSISSSARSSTTTTTTTTRRSPSSSASSVHTHLTRPSADMDEPDPPALTSAVEISIARQISISRQQRTLLLRPLKTDVAGQTQQARPGRGPGTSPAGKMVVSRKEGRVVETKTGTPTETVDSHPAAHRKSERVVLDGL